MRRLIAEPDLPERLTGAITVPASKYHAHRALILGSLAEGCSQIFGRSDALHVRMTLGALRRMGTRIVRQPDGSRVWGGPYRPTTPRITVGSSGSTLQFLLGLGSRSVGPALVFDGQPSLRRRPIGPLLEGLRAMGVGLEARGEALPVTIHPGRPSGGAVAMPGTLSQWISGLLLLAPFASEDTEITVAPPVNERPYIDLTLRMMAAWGVEVERDADFRRLRVAAGQRYRPAAFRLPADLSSAAFPLVAAALLPSDVTFHGIAPDPDHPEAAVLDVLREAGVDLRWEAGGLRLRSDGRPQGVRVDCGDAPDLVPALAVFGALASGCTVLERVEHARLKESDRVAAMLQLRRMGVRIDEEGPGRLVIHGRPRLRAAEITSFNDHRVLMAFAVAGCFTDGGRTEISYPRAYHVSYPGFLQDMTTLGFRLSVQETADDRQRGPWATVPTAHLAAEIRSMMSPAWTAAQRAAGLWPERLITDALDDAAAWTPDRPAVVDPSLPAEFVLTYGELQRAVDRAATALLGMGVRPGEPVAFQLPNWWEFTVLQLALVRIGAVSCPLMPMFRERELRFMLRQSGCRFLFVPARFRGHDHVAMAEGLRGELPGLERVIVVRGDPGAPEAFERLLDAAPDAEALAAARPSPDAVAQLLYTSGTSGEPKGVLHTHNTLLTALHTHMRHYRLTDRSTVFIPSPAGHQTGFLYGMWLAVALGATAVFQDVWDPERALASMDAWRVAFVQASTPFLSDLADAARRRKRPPAGLHIFVATGAPVPRLLARMARSALRCEVMGGWGTTESGLVAGGAPGDDPERLWQTDGRVLPPQEMRVVDAEGRDVPPGAEGRFLVRTPAMFVGYLGHPDWYAHAFVGDRWFDTGDLATIDADGYMRITGRIKDVINRGGEKIPAAEIEQCLYAHPAVAEVAVVGMPDPRLGERACACVVLRDGADLTLEDVRAHLQQARMAKQYWPERVEVMAEMPRTASGKIQKFILRERVAANLAVEGGSPSAPASAGQGGRS
jgi:3-phosphoshikimate 1-carboxyvinyltransferase